MRIVLRDLIEGAALSSAGGGGLAKPINNLQSGLRKRVARTVGVSDWTILVDFTESQTLTDIVLWRHNLSDAGEWSASVFEGAGQTGAQVDIGPFVVGADPNPPRSYRWASAILPESFTARSMAITLSDPGNMAGYLELNRLLVGNALVLDTPQDWGSNLVPRTEIQAERLLDGGLLSEVRPGYRELSVSMSFLTEEERARLFAAELLRLQIWISAQHGRGGALERDYSMIGRITRASGSASKAYGRWGDSWTVSEI